MADNNLRAFFYRLVILGGEEAADASEFIWNLFSNPELYSDGRSLTVGQSLNTGMHFEFREMATVGNVTKGCLALLRDDIPSLRRVDGIEMPIPVQEGDRILEKNYFLYFKDTQVLVWQFNLKANHVSNISTLLSAMCGLERLVTYQHLVKDIFVLNPDHVIEYVDLKVSEPKKLAQKTEIDQLDPTDWSVNPFKILADSGSRQLSIKMQNRSDAGLKKKGLWPLVEALTDLSVTRKLKVKVEGAAEPIDMLAERFTYKVPLSATEVDRATRYFAALQEAKDKFDAEQVAENYK